MCPDPFINDNTDIKICDVTLRYPGLMMLHWTEYWCELLTTSVTLLTSLACHKAGGGGGSPFLLLGLEEQGPLVQEGLVSRVTGVHHRVSGPGTWNMVSGNIQQLTMILVSALCSVLFVTWVDWGVYLNRGFDLNLGLTIVDDYSFGYIKDFYGGKINKDE